MRALALAALLGVVTTASVVQATSEPEPAPLNLLVNEEVKGIAIVLVRDQDVLIQSKDLDEAGIHGLPAKGREVIDGTTYVVLSALEPALRYVVDDRSLTLRITASPEYLDTTIISLRPAAPRDMVRYRDAGLFLNYAPRLVDFRTFAASGEAGLSLAGQLLASGFSYDRRNGLARGLTNLTIDEPAAERRWVVGDAFVGGGSALAGATYLGGLTVERTFDLDPYFVHVPTLNTTGLVSTASTLEVYVNGNLVRREAVSPGRFQINTLPVTTGAGTTRYVLVDAFGRQQQIVSPFYMSAAVLARGITDYAVSAGLVRNGVGLNSLGYGQAAALARYRVGVTDKITVGVRGEATPTLFSAGESFTLLTPVGQLDLGFAASVAEAERGAAGSLSYGYQSQWFSTGLGARSMTSHYSNTSLQPFSDRDLFDGLSFVSVPIGQHATITSNYSLGVARDRGLTASVGMQSSFLIDRAATLNLAATRHVNQDGSDTFEAFATLTLQLGRSVSGSATVHTLGAQREATLAVNKGLPPGTGYGFQASVTRGQRTTAVASAEGQTQLGQAEAYVSSVDSEVHSQLSLAGAIVLVPKAGLFLTRPIQDGYAVIQVPGADNVRGYLNNNEIGRTNSAGNLLVPNLISYYGNRLSINDADLPLDYRIDTSEYVAAPPYRGGAVVRFDARRTFFVRGFVSVRRGRQETVPSYGEVTLRSGVDQLSSPIARDGEFEFEGLPPGLHQAHIEYAGGACEMSLWVPKPASAVLELGALVCVHD